MPRPDVNFFERCFWQFVIAFALLVLFCIVAAYVTYRLNRYRVTVPSGERSRDTSLPPPGGLGNELVKYDPNQGTTFAVDDGVETEVNPMFELKRAEMMRKMADQTANLEFARERNENRAKIVSMEDELAAMRAEMKRLKMEGQRKERADGSVKKLKKDAHTLCMVVHDSRYTPTHVDGTVYRLPARGRA